MCVLGDASDVMRGLGGFSPFRSLLLRKAATWMSQWEVEKKKKTRLICGSVLWENRGIWNEMDIFCAVLNKCRQCSFCSWGICLCACVCVWMKERESAYSEWSVGCICIKAHSSDWEWMSSLCCASNLLCLACPPVDWGALPRCPRTHAHTHTHTHTHMHTHRRKGYICTDSQGGSPLSPESTTLRLLMKLRFSDLTALLMLSWHCGGKTTTDEGMCCLVQMSLQDDDDLGWWWNKSKVACCSRCVLSQNLTASLCPKSLFELEPYFGNRLV